MHTKKHFMVADFANEEQSNLIARSQAKRILERVEKFKEVVFDFQGVEFIGQGFADEIFRVFKNQHPQISLYPINTTSKIDKMIAHVASSQNVSE